MLRNMLIDFTTMSEDAFFAMMRDFYETYRGRDASTRDFQEIVEKYTGMDMTWFFDQWVYRSDVPTYDFSYEIIEDSDGTYLARGRVVTEDVPDDFRMYVPLEIEIDDDLRAYVRLLIDMPDYEFTLPGLPGKPKKLRLNPFESVLAKVKQ